jgi:WD40 repeat protein
LVNTLQGHAGGVSSVALSADGQLVASGSTDGTVRGGRMGRCGFFAGNVYYSASNNLSNFRSDRLSQLTDELLLETDSAKQRQIYSDWLDYST